MSYDILAGFYDLLNRDTDYSEWADGIVRFLKKNGVHEGASIADVACGTGRMTVELAKRGYRMLGTDLSSEMLSVAECEASENRLPITFVCQDMTCLELGQTFDAMTCCLDSLNYLPTRDALGSFFSRASEHLSMGGYLFFDLNSEYKFRSIYANNSYVYDEKKVFCVWQNFYSERRRLCDFELTFFIKEKDGSYRRECEMQREYVYSDAEVTELLTNNGFELVSISGDTDFDRNEGISVRETDERHYFIARKIK